MSRTTCCWRSRSSPSWARSSNAAGWRRTCWKASASCSARCRGGLAYAVIIVGAILGAITGTVAASVIAMGMICAADHDALRLRHADRHRRDRGLRHHHPAHPALAGADRAGRPARQARSATCMPAPSARRSCRCCCSAASSSAQHLRPAQGAGRCRPRRARCAAGRCLAGACKGMVPSIVLIFLVLGTIFMGLATPTEAGAMGAVGAMAARGDQRPPHLGPAAAGDGQHHAHHRHGDLHPDRLHGVLAWCSRASTARSGSSTCCRRCRAGRSAS